MWFESLICECLSILLDWAARSLSYPKLHRSLPPRRWYHFHWQVLKLFLAWNLLVAWLEGYRRYQLSSWSILEARQMQVLILSYVSAHWSCKLFRDQNFTHCLIGLASHRHPWLNRCAFSWILSFCDEAWCQSTYWSQIHLALVP